MRTPLKKSKKLDKRQTDEALQANNYEETNLKDVKTYLSMISITRHEAPPVNVQMSIPSKSAEVTYKTYLNN